MFLLSDKLSCCATCTNGCLDLRRCAFALDGRVSAEWSRCPGSMARRAGDNVAPMRRSSASWLPARIRRLSAGAGRRHPVTIRRYEHCGTRQERCILQLNAPGQRWLFATLLLQNPNRSQQAASRARRVMSAYREMTQGVGDT